MWAKFKFVLWLPFRDFYFISYRPLFPLCQKALEKRQQDVLSLRRLHYVKDIRLSIRHGYGWPKVAHHLQIILNHPSIKKPSLGISIERGPCNEEAEQLAAELVKFEEVDLTEWHQLSLDGETLQEPNILALLRPLISASGRGNSKLKKLSLSQFDEEEHSGALLQARERFELVNVKNQVESENDIDYEEDYEELRQMLINRLREEGL